MREGNYTYEIREKQLLISTIGGIVNSQTGSCLPHGMSYFLTHFKRIPHGLACGLLIKEYLAIFNDKTNINKILALTGFADLDDFGAFINDMLQLDIEVSEEEIERYAEEFSSQKHRFKRHPEPAGKEEVLRIYRNSPAEKIKASITRKVRLSARGGLMRFWTRMRSQTNSRRLSHVEDGYYRGRGHCPFARAGLEYIGQCGSHWSFGRQSRERTENSR
jgi:hypothetical protein